MPALAYLRETVFRLSREGIFDNLRAWAYKDVLDELSDVTRCNHTPPLFAPAEATDLLARITHP